MKKLFAIFTFFLFSATTSTPAAELPKGGDLVVSNLVVKNKTSLSKTKPYLATIDIRTTGEPVDIIEMCFLWSGEGPFCFNNFKMAKDSSGGVHPTMMLKTGNPGAYTLAAYMRYSIGGKKFSTNQIKTNIKVK